MSNINRRQLLSLAGTALFMSGGSSPAAAADTWPSRPIRMIVPFTAGGGADIVGRIVADSLSTSLGQPVIVDNRAGAGGVIGNDFVAKAPADGYTLLFTNASSTVMLTAIGQKTPYDLERDLQPVGQVCAGGILLVSRADFPANDLKQTFERIRAQPGKFQYGTWGAGSTGHLLMEAMKYQQHMDLVHVPYKGAAPIIQDVMGGVLQLGWADPAAAAALVRTGKLKPLAISGSFRAPDLPDIATMSEQGFPLGGDGWVGLFSRRGTPQPIVDRLSREVSAALDNPAVVQRLTSLNLVKSRLRTPQEFERSVREDMHVWRDLIQQNNIVIDL